MGPTLKSLRALADPTRLRILAVLSRAELSVHELQEITTLVQSRISTHLAQLQEAGLVQSRREGKRAFYRLARHEGTPLRVQVELALQGAGELREHGADLINLRRVLALREDQARLFFNQVAGRFDRSYGPGRSWQAFGQMLLRLLPPLTVADLGAGEGLLSELLALRCRRVIAVDNSERIIAFGAAKAQQAGIRNLEFRLGDLEDPPIPEASVDLVVLSQALHHAGDPQRALRSAHRILRPRGQAMILDLRQHGFEQAHELYGDRWLGFAESDLNRWLEEAGFTGVEVSVVAREEEAPHFETLLASGVKGP
ncbi:MAG: metalloregulator ArsR/SmtB family transcription factor [Verrucomicrobiae bacterium]|nr:metalloregulator ArsR/SmtB family transcription factor [Verrucomicrobiae bacterium]